MVIPPLIEIPYNVNINYPVDEHAVENDPLLAEAI